MAWSLCGGPVTAKERLQRLGPANAGKRHSPGTRLVVRVPGEWAVLGSNQ